MRNELIIRNSSGEPQPGLAVELYNWQAGSPYYSTKVGDFTDNGDGSYHIDLSDSVKGTLLIDSVVNTATIGRLFNGELGATSIPDGSITTAKLANSAVTTIKIADEAVTPAKTTFAEDF